MAIFPFFFFILGTKGQKNLFYDILERKNAFLGYKTRSLKRPNIEKFLKGFSMVLVKKWPFFHGFFLSNVVLVDVFYDILERKNACLGSKNNKFKKFKN